MYILIPFPALIPGLLLLPVLASLFIDNLLRSAESKKYKQIFLTSLFSIAGLFFYGVISVGLIFIMPLLEGLEDTDIFWIANGIIFPTLIVLTIFWFKRKSLETKRVTQNDVFASIIYALLFFAFLSMSGYFLESIHIALLFIFPGLIGLWLSTKISPHTWRFFLANIILSFSSLILFGILALGFASQ